MRIKISQQQSTAVIDTAGKRKGFSIQNLSAADIFVTDDQRTLDSVDAANLPTVGHLFAAASQTIVVYPFFIGRLYARTQGPGAALEVMPYEVDLC